MRLITRRTMIVLALALWNTHVRLVILHAIWKKRQNLRERDIALAEQRYEEVTRRSHDESA